MKFKAFIEKIKAKIIVYLEATKARLARSETYTIFLPALLACLLLLTFIPYLFDNSALRFQIEQRVSAALKTNFEIDGKVEVALLPSPAITVNDVFLQNYNSNGKNYNLYAKKATIKLSFLSSLMGDFAVKKIIFSQAILQSYFTDNKPQETNDSLAELINKKNELNLPKKENSGAISGKIFVDLFKLDQFDAQKFSAKNFPKVEVEDSVLITYDKFSNKKEVSKINLEAAFSNKKIIANGSFSNQEIINNFELYAKFEDKSDVNSQDYKSSLSLTSPYGNFKISGIFPEQNFGLFDSKFRGKIEAEIFDLKNFYKSFITPDGFIYNKISPTHTSVKIKATITNDNQKILINNIFVNSNIVNGRGDIEVDLSTKLPIIDIRLNLENIDLDAIWLSEKEIALANNNTNNQEDKTQESSQDDANKEDDNKEKNSDESASSNASQDLQIEAKKDDDSLSLDLTKNIRDFDLTAELTVSRVKYLDEEMKNISLYATISKQGEILILPLTLEVPGGGMFRMSGVLDNQNVPKFIGSLDASGPKIADIFKWLGLESQNLIYDNLKEYSLYADIMLVPNSAILNNVYLNINNAKTELLGEMHIHYTQKSSGILSNFHISNLVIDDYFLTSGQNIYLSPGSLLKKLLWLNSLSSNHDISLYFDQMSYKNSVFKDQAIKVRCGQGYLEVNDLKLNSSNINLSTSIAIDISKTKPRFDFSIKGKNFEYVQTKNIQDDKTEIAKPQNNTIDALDQFYALPSLEGFSGNINLDLENANFDNFNAKNTKISGKLKDGILNFINFTTDIYGGNLSFDGVIGVKFDKAISGNINFKEVSLKPLLSDLVDVNNINATANINASIQSVAEKKSDFFKNLNSAIKFSLVSASFDGYGLNDLIKKMFNAKNYSQDLQNPEEILFNKIAQTSFKQGSGTVEIEKGRNSSFKIDLKTVAANAIFSGTFNLTQQTLDASMNTVFLTGNIKKQIPINIATNFKGEIKNLQRSTNLDQVYQYLGLKSAPTGSSGSYSFDTNKVSAAMKDSPNLNEKDQQDNAQNNLQNLPPNFDQNQIILQNSQNKLNEPNMPTDQNSQDFLGQPIDQNKPKINQELPQN